ncbi:hypothetical protein [Oceanicoccus sagamiensis]|uniref:Uncharacterized protein n=1 Tax=Oceanicoccus sagamiensis TaxID=716816 RepID=A0A1X9NGK8_9GAMM|nr:hypothetical protein [Oceanicoccus sagamiensis]ARN74639.1 hypothetical protein BST96_11205 [Oceanicoccus sagamiensis]
MDMISNIPQQHTFQPISFDEQVALVSECLLMAGAIKRHNEDAAIVFGDESTLDVVDDMARVMDGADELLAELTEEKPLNAFEAQELQLVWNKLRHLVAATYQGSYFSNSLYN